jgi:hypothetical protein
MPGPGVPRPLTAAQLRFVQAHAATLGDRAATDDRSIYVYRDDGHASTRWLLDRHGRVTERIWFLNEERRMPGGE